MVEIHHPSHLGLDCKPAGLVYFATSSLIFKVQSSCTPSFRARPSVNNPIIINGVRNILEVLQVLRSFSRVGLVAVWSSLNVSAVLAIITNGERLRIKK